MGDEFLLTKEKHQALKKELEELTNVRRKEIAKNLEYAKSLGDLSENAEYHEARTEQAEVEDRIRRIEHILKNATIVSHKKSDVVEVGSTVGVKKKGSSTAQTFHIVGSEESNILEGNISYSSPFGAALLGKKKGDACTVTTPAGTTEYIVISVE